MLKALSNQKFIKILRLVAKFKIIVSIDASNQSHKSVTVSRIAGRNPDLDNVLHS